MEEAGGGLGHGGDHLVPGGVPEGVVIQLELVDVEHTDGEGQLEADGLPPAHQALLLVPAAVCHAGELIHHGLPPELHLVVVELDMGIHPGLDNHRAEGLGHVVHRPQQQPPLLVLDVRQAGQQDHRDKPGQLGALQLLQQGEAVHLGHHHVQQDQGKAPLLGGAQARLGGVAGGNVVIGS